MLRATTRGLLLARGARPRYATLSSSAGAAAVEANSADLAPAHGLAGRYAGALYSSAVRASKLDVVKQEVDKIQSMRESSKSLDELLLDPTLPRDLKGQTLDMLFKKGGFSDVSRNFMLVLAENGRTAQAEQILKAFQDMIKSQKGDIVAQLTMCGPVPEWEFALIRKHLKKILCPQGQQLTIKSSYDENLLGGFTVQVDDKFIDCSTRTELRKLQSAITEAVYDL